MSSIQDGDAPGSAQAALAATTGTGAAASSAEGKRTPTPRNCRNFIRRQTAKAMPEIVGTFVDKAKHGSVPHFTSLAKLGGFDQRTAEAETPRRKRKSLARQLLDEVQRYEARQAAELAAEQAAAEAAGPQIDDQNSNRSLQESS